MFNKPSEWTFVYWQCSGARLLLEQMPKEKFTWIPFDEMNEYERDYFNHAEETGGFLKRVKVTKEERNDWWNGLEDAEKEIIFDLPNFDPDIFEETTIKGLNGCRLYIGTKR